MDLFKHQDMTGRLAQLVDELKQESDYDRTRELSIAITYLQTAQLWFREVPVETAEGGNNAL